MQDLVAKHEIVIDVAKKAFVEIEVVKGSRRSILLKFFFVENGEKFDMQNVKLAEIKGTTPGGGRVFKNLDVLEDGSIEYLISDTILVESGKTTCELQLIGPYGEVLVCHEISIKVLPNSFDENEYVAEDDISAVRAYVMRAEKAAETSEGVKEYVGKTTESYQMLEEELQQTKEEFENYTDKVKERIENGEFIGPPGIQGKAGKQGEPGKQGKQGIQGKTGESGIVTPASGYFTLSVDEDGNVYANYADEDHPPQFEMDEEMNVYLLMDDDTKVFIGNVKPQSNQVQKAVNTYLEEHPVEEGKVDLHKTANGYDYGYAGQVAVGNGAGAVEWKNPEVKYYGTLEEMLADEQLYNYMFAVVVGENDTLDGRSATYFIYDKPVNGSVKLEKRELYACKIPVWYVSTNEQALTDGQKEQVRENIGAAAKADVEEKEKRLEEEILNLAIKPTTDPATSLHLQDSAKYRVLDMSMQGKTEQATTTGAQLFDLASTKGFVSLYTGLSTKIDVENNTITTTNTHTSDRTGFLDLGVLKVGSYYIAFENVNGYTTNPSIYYGELETGVTKLTDISLKGEVFTLTEDTHCWFVWVVNNVTPLKIKNLMLNSGTTAKPFEPYTGGAASPNPNYPQDINNAGRYNAETGRYEIEVEVCNKNYFNGGLLTSFFADVKGNMSSVAENHEKYRSILMNLPQGTYTVVSSERCHFVRFLENDTLTNIGVGNTNSYTFTTIGGVVGVSFRKQDNTIWDDSITIHVGKGPVATKYVPHQSKQITLTSDRPITEWDRLEKRNGVYGWVYNAAEYEVTGKELYSMGEKELPTYNTGTSSNAFFTLDNLDKKSSTYTYRCVYCKELSWVSGVWHITDGTIGITNNFNQIHMRFPNTLLGVADDATKDEKLSAYKAYLQQRYADGNPVKIQYRTVEEVEFVPLPQEEQDALNALETYYGVTNVWNDQECPMQIQYVADTKLYMDNKILEIQSAVI